LALLSILLFRDLPLHKFTGLWGTIAIILAILSCTPKAKPADWWACSRGHSSVVLGPCFDRGWLAVASLKARVADVGERPVGHAGDGGPEGVDGRAPCRAEGAHPGAHPARCDGELELEEPVQEQIHPAAPRHQFKGRQVRTGKILIGWWCVFWGGGGVSVLILRGTLIFHLWVAFIVSHLQSVLLCFRF